MTVAGKAEPALELRSTWGRPRTFMGWLTDVGHRSIGIRYVITGMAFFALGGIAALTMRAQLAVPNNDVLSPDRYDQVFTMHGVTMMFLFAVPIMEGFALYLIPLTIGTRELSFPRLNAFGYWSYLIGGVVLWTSFLFHAAPDAGWFNYPPLSSGRFDPPANIDIYVTAIPLLEIAAVVAAIELAATILAHRAPGMSLARMPLYAWAVLVMAAMIVVAMPPLIADCLLLLGDRNFATHFFDPLGGGSPLLWQHLFWFFGHPEVYIMLLPGLGIVATIASTFARRPTAAYHLVVFSYVAIGAISFAVWGHHMFAGGEPVPAMATFSAASESIVIPSGIQVFSLLATLWFGRVRLSVPLLFVVGFVVVFVTGGLTGAEIASIPFDLQVTDSYFIVAHFHYTLLGGVVLPLLAGVYYWYPKMTGRMLDDRLGTVSFILIFLGINVTFFPMHLAGLDGMPRRVYTYPSGLGWDRYQALATVGSVLLALGMLAYLANLLVSLRRGAVAGPNPWSAGTLEWLTESPPQDEAFPYTPVVQSAYPLWNVQTEPAMVEVIEPVRHDRRESLGTSIIEGEPEQRTVEPGPSLVPLLTAACVALALVGAAVDPLVSLAGMALTAVAALRWAWPTPEQRHEAAHPSEQDPLPTSWTASERGLKTPPQHAILGAMAAIGAFDLSVIAGYWYLAQANPRWPVAGVDVPDWWPILLSCLLLSVAAAAAWAGRPGGQIPPPAGLALTIATTVAAFVPTALELASEDWNWATNSTGSAEWAVLLAAGFVAASSAVMAAAAAGYARGGLFAAGAADALVVSRWYATFTFAVSLVAAATVELGPRVL